MNCPGTLEEHVADIFGVLGEVGMGGGCETTYKALVEVAEAFRIANKYAHYVPVMAEEIAAAATDEMGNWEPPNGVWN